MATQALQLCLLPCAHLHQFSSTGTSLLCGSRLPGSHALQHSQEFVCKDTLLLCSFQVSSRG